MNERDRQIVDALRASTFGSEVVGQNVGMKWTLAFHFVMPLAQIVEIMERITRSNGDLFSGSTLRKRPRKGRMDPGAYFLTCVGGTDFGQARRHFRPHIFNPLIELFEHHTQNLHVYGAPPRDGEVEECNACVSLIRAEARSERFRKRLNNFYRSSKKNFRNLTTYVSKLCSVFETLFVMRVDVGYNEQYWSTLTYDQVMAQRSKFLRSFKKILPEDTGYAWKLEFGVEKFWHFHLAVFLNGKHSHRKVEIADSLRRCWEGTITAGKGLFRDCSTNPTHYPAGLIARNDVVGRASLRKLIIYMTLPARYIKITAAGRDHTFGKSGIPKQEKPRTRFKPATKRVVQAPAEQPDRSFSNQSAFASWAAKNMDAPALESESVSGPDDLSEAVGCLIEEMKPR